MTSGGNAVSPAGLWCLSGFALGSEFTLTTTSILSDQDSNGTRSVFAYFFAVVDGLRLGCVVVEDRLTTADMGSRSFSELSRLFLNSILRKITRSRSTQCQVNYSSR